MTEYDKTKYKQCPKCNNTLVYVDVPVRHEFRIKQDGTTTQPRTSTYRGFADHTCGATKCTKCDANMEE